MHRQVIQFLLVIAFASLCALLIYRSHLSQLADSNTSQQLNHQSQVLASISLFIASADFSLNTRQGLSEFLAVIDGHPEVDYWKLKNDYGAILGQKLDKNNNLVSQFLGSPSLFYLPAENENILTLELYISHMKPASHFLGVVDLFVVLFISLFVIGAGTYFFRWIVDVQQLAQSILSQTNEHFEISTQAARTPIARALIQQQNANRELKNNKEALLEQIRKTTYVDDETELGNKSFFKAEFQVRLFHHESPESGLLVLFSFVEADWEGIPVLNSQKAIQIANLLKQFSSGFEDAIVARLQSNDFVLLVPNQTRSDVDRLCRKVIEQLSKAVFDKSPVKEHFVDIGISAYQQGFDYYKVLAEADMALRNAQLQGGNNWFMYGEALSEKKIKGHLKWTTFLRRVLDKRLVQLFGQRIVYFNSAETVHQEIYIRIEEGNELMSADTFLPMANQCGLASEFDRQVVDGIIKHCKHRGEKIDNHYFSINLFITSLLDDRFVGWLIGKLSSFPNLCQHFVFEIKEAYISQHRDKLKLVMNQIASLGVKWCVERFGAPDEDLNYLEMLPISMVKIDRRIINQVSEDKQQQLMIKSLLINLKSLDIKAFAEGVEKAADAEYLQSIGLDGAQGYFYSKPRRLDGMEQFLKVI